MRTEIEVLSAGQGTAAAGVRRAGLSGGHRLKYRFLDLRRETLHKNIVLRTKIIARCATPHDRGRLHEFQTPILTASSPEGARDFLVPSRIHPGKFYALPQAPQQYKQLLMVAGFDRYFQIAPCFRDEDPRADRLPGEFYQLDVEMSFVTQEDVFAAMEPVLRGVFESSPNGKPVTRNSRAFPMTTAMRKYGSDKPDLRNPIDAGCDRAFPRLRLQGLRQHDRQRPEGRGLGHSRADRRQPRLLRPHERLGAGRGPAGAGLHLLARGRRQAGRRRPDRQEHRPRAHRGDPRAARPRPTATPCSSSPAIRRSSYKFAGEARTRAGEELNLIDKDRFELCWIVDFPFYEWNEDEKKIDFATTRSRCRRAASRR
jgi:aspartyl-tRNA synthetase